MICLPTPVWFDVVEKKQEKIGILGMTESVPYFRSQIFWLLHSPPSGRIQDGDWGQIPALVPRVEKFSYAVFD